MYILLFNIRKIQMFLPLDCGGGYEKENLTDIKIILFNLKF